MAFQHGKSTSVLVNEHDLSDAFRNVDWSRTCEAADTTTFGKDSKTYIPGLKDGSMSAEGLFEGTVDGTLATALGVAGSLVTFFLQGASTQSGRVKLAKAIETTHDISSPVADVVSTSAEFQPSGGVWGGVALEPLTAKTATGDGTSVDNGAASSDGWVASLHCTAASGTTPTLDATIEHSADDTTFATLGTFAQLTAAGSEQIEGTGTVNRYVRAERTIAGTDPSFTFAIAFARK